MIRSLVFLLAIAGFSAAQYRPQQHGIDYAQAAILSDTRYLSGDGTFGAAYTQEDGVEFKEESDVDGNRRGSYSYVDPSGQRRTVTYTAGKNGFQASGDHLPVPPAPIPQPQPQPQYQPQYTPQYQPQPQPQPQYRAQAFPQFPPQARQPFVPASPAQYDDGQYRESYNNPQPQITQAIQGANPTGQYSYSYAPTPSPVAYSPVSQYNGARFAQPAAVTPAPAPHRFFPPGKLDLNRTPDGFSYTFTKS